MNDDPASTPANRPPTPRPTTGDVPTDVPPPENNEEPARKRLRGRLLAQTKRKSEFIHDIIVNLDMLIYAELCILYYMDCSLIRFVLRALTQGTFLTPNPAAFKNVAKRRPYLPVIFGTNAMCFLLHSITARPSAGEMARGYLHGGVIIDFIGQKAPTSKFSLLFLDLLVLALQCFMLVIHVEEERLKAALASKDILTELAAVRGQDYDSEERGVARDAGMDSNDIELQQMASSRVNNPDAMDQEEQDILLAERTRRADGEGDDGPLDLFYSGNLILGDFHVLHTLRQQWVDHDAAAAGALQTVGQSTTFEWERARVRVMRRLDTLH